MHSEVALVLVVFVILGSMAVGTFIWQAVESRRAWQQMDRLLEIPDEGRGGGTE